MATETAMQHYIAHLPLDVLNQIVAQLEKSSHLAALNSVNKFFQNMTKEALTQRSENPFTRQMDWLTVDITRKENAFFLKYFHKATENEINGLGLQKNKLTLLKEVEKVKSSIHNKKEFEEAIDNILTTHPTLKDKTAYHIMVALIADKTKDALDSFYQKLPDAEGQKGTFGPVDQYKAEQINIDNRQYYGQISVPAETKRLHYKSS